MQTEAKETMLTIKSNWKETEDNITQNFLMIQWLGRCAITAEGMHSIPGQGTTIRVSRTKQQKQMRTKK